MLPTPTLFFHILQLVVLYSVNIENEPLATTRK